MKPRAALDRPVLPGLKVHASDVARRLAAPLPVPVRLLEIHLDPRDLVDEAESMRATFAPLAERFLLAVHQPFALPDGSLLDPLADDPGRARASAAALGDAAELAAAIDASFLILHPGGVRAPGEPPASPAELAAFLAGFEAPVPVLLENMPYWYHLPDGRRGATALGTTPDTWLDLDELVAGFCLDTSHAWGARDPGSEANAREFFALGPRILHVHAAASAPPDVEGLPLGTGEPGAAFFRDLARAVGPRVAVVPEPRGQERDPRLAADALSWLEAAGALSDVR